MQKKIIDTSSDISKGGRADRFWSTRIVKSSNKFEVSGLKNKESEPAEICETFKMKGFEFGNWVNNNDREEKMLALHHSLKHLSLILGSKNLGFDKKLGIALGARGNGGKAIAHFEPSYYMINLTKELGIGSLAHEYGHSLDYFFGTFIDQNKQYSALSCGSSISRKIDNNTGGELRLVMDKILDIIFKTDSYKKLVQIATGNEYWIRRNEIFARVFEQWVQYKLQEKGIRNTFLAKSKYETAVYLRKKDFEKVLPSMNKLAKTMARLMNNRKPEITQKTETKKAADTKKKK